MSLNFSPGTVFHMDNLDALRGMNSETVDLIATDPPFNTGRNRESVGGKYVDQWRWGDNVHPIWMDHIRDDNRALVEVVEGAMHAHSKNLGAFLCFLSVRLLEMKRVLKPTGSIYLHCDPTASHYIKAAMDAVFGMKNFRNEIVWKRLTGGSGRSRNRFSRVHDLIYFYAMGNKSAFNTIYEQYSDEHIQGFYRHEDARGPFGLGDLTAKGPRTGSSGKPWRGIDIGAKSKHWYAPAAFPLGVKQPANWDDMSSQEKLDFLDDNGLIYWPSKVGGMPRFKRYLSVGKGTPMSDMVLDISPIQGSSKEKTGYPDQKPIPLYERLILAASKPGDLVLDPFCGCGTTIMAAKKNNRLWVGPF